MAPPQNSSFRGRICFRDKKDTVNWEVEAWCLVLALSLSPYVTWPHPLALLGPTFIIKRWSANLSQLALSFGLLHCLCAPVNKPSPRHRAHRPPLLTSRDRICLKSPDSQVLSCPLTRTLSRALPSVSFWIRLPQQNMLPGSLCAEGAPTPRPSFTGDHAVARSPGLRRAGHLVKHSAVTDLNT